MNASKSAIANIKMPELKIGNSGEAVRLLQQFLILRYGYIFIPFDAQFNVETEEAIKDFQAYNGLVVDGIVGENTWRVLGSHIGC